MVVMASEGLRQLKVAHDCKCAAKYQLKKLEVSPVIFIDQIEWFECQENAMFKTRKQYDLEYQNQGKKWMTTHFYDS